MTKTEKAKMTLNDKQDCIASLNACLSRTANWRRGMQAKYPNDSRNRLAAETLDKLASEANDLTDEAWENELKPFFNWTSQAWSDAVSQVSRMVEFRGVNTFPGFTRLLARVLSQSSVAA
jgi:hypothetical protein